MKTLFLMVLTLTFSLSGFAADRPAPKPRTTARPTANRAPAAQAPQTKPAPVTAKPATASDTPRKKEINFEERVLEGLGDRGYEKLNQTGNVDAGSRDRLYKKRAEFDEESQYLLREMEYLK